jgi:polysaccharide chain length determinant protein (PEP-CTERM system associated)
MQRERSQFEDLVAVAISALNGMWRYRWLALWVAWVTCAVGWTIVYAMPDVYQASTRVSIDAESMIKRAVGDLTVPSDMMTEVNILTRAMLSQPHLEEIARLANLDLAAKTPEDHERMIVNLGKRISLTREGAENIFRISFRDSNRDVAATVVQTILDNFVEDAQGERRTDSEDAEAFVEQQIQEYERRLNDAETRRADFKRDNIGMMPGETGDYYTRLQGAMQSLDTLRAELRLATERKAEYEKQLVGEEPVFGILAPSLGGGGSFGGTDALIAQYQKDLNTLLLKYTESHPDVVALRETIARLVAQRDEERPQVAGLSSGTSMGPGQLETNQFYQSMRIGLGATDVEIRALRSKVGAEEASIKELQRLVDTIPEIERQLTALNRDYEVTRQNYEELLQRRESLYITGEVEETGDQLQFNVIDEPRASAAPVGPDRPLLLVATAVGGVVLALALAFLLQLVNPAFTSRRELREITGLPVLGTLSLAESTKDRSISRRKTLMFASVAAGLPVALGLAVLLEGPAQRALAGLLS